MSGPGAKGPKQRVRVYQSGQATYLGGGIQREGMVDVDSRLSRQTKKVLIGLRVPTGQDVVLFRVFGRKAGHQVEIPVTREAPGGAIATQLQAIAPEAGERWIGYEADYNVTNHGKNGFTTKIEVNHFTANANGFQELPTAFTYKDPAGNEFTAGHYIVGTSILPGQNAAAEPPPEHLPARAAQGKPKSKPKKKKATAKTAGTKKSKGKRRR